VIISRHRKIKIMKKMCGIQLIPIPIEHVLLNNPHLETPISTIKNDGLSVN